ncbi:MAG: hypothetical protein ACHQ50_14810 [Fimbriimonadales bacterium]
MSLSCESCELDGGIGLINFDLPDKKVNTLGRAVLQELSALVPKGCAGYPAPFPPASFRR